VVSATNADLPAMIRAGTFREDLYYRLNVIELKIPPLRERVEDVLPLAQAFLGDALSLSDAARRSLLAHAWPGNVRELRNAITRASLLCRNGVVEPADLGLAPVAVPAAVSVDPPLPEPTREDVELALLNARGVIADAAAALGLSRQALYRRMEKWGLSSR
jgi:transcriptional regulator of acetoin/glycerol metabolism